MTEHEDHGDRPEIAQRNARNGLILFAIYVALYGGFILLAVFRSDLLAAPSIGGVNLAITYGFGLIVAALVLALIYTVLCRRGLKP